MNKPAPPPTLITSNQQFAEICARLQEAGVAAMDTEFERIRTYHAQLALLQLGIDADQCWLIDPLAIDDWAPLQALLADPHTVKLLHSCEEDVELLARVADVHPQNVFDTQVASAFAGYGYSPGYNKLVEAILGHQLAKGEQRSDWMRRPLSDSQLHYARADVEYLPALYAHLVERLEQRGFMAWCQAECAEIIARRLHQGPLFDARNFRNARQLSPQQLAAVQLLGEWREQQARQQDLPRNWLFKDEELLAIVEAAPQDCDALLAIPGIRRTRGAQKAEELLQLLQQGAATPDADCPVPHDLPTTAQSRSMVQPLMECARKRATELQLPPELLAPRKRIQALVNGGFPAGPWELPDSLQGWRAEAVGGQLLAQLDAAAPGAGT